MARPSAGMGERSTLRVSVVGAGAWGTAICKIIANNVRPLKEFDSEVRLWAYPEVVDGVALGDGINARHENVKYLPGIDLPGNITARPLAPCPMWRCCMVLGKLTARFFFSWGCPSNLLEGGPRVCAEWGRSFWHLAPKVLSNLDKSFPPKVPTIFILCRLWRYNFSSRAL